METKIEYYSSGQIKWRISEKYLEYFYRDGLIHAEGNLKKKSKIGRWSYYDRKGNLEQEQYFI